MFTADQLKAINESLAARLAPAAQALLDALGDGLMDEPQPSLVAGTVAVLARELLAVPWVAAWALAQQGAA